jgi:hypothetical protein
MIRRSLLLFVFVVAQVHAADPIERFRTARWSETTTLAALPERWRTALAKGVVERIAEKDGWWNAGCVVDSSLPRRRFVVAGTAAGLGVVVYDHGGFAMHQHAVCFTIADQSTYSVVANLEVRGVEDAGDLRDALEAANIRRANHY